MSSDFCGWCKHLFQQFNNELPKIAAYVTVGSQTYPNKTCVRAIFLIVILMLIVTLMLPTCSLWARQLTHLLSLPCPWQQPRRGRENEGSLGLIHAPRIGPPTQWLSPGLGFPLYGTANPPGRSPGSNLIFVDLRMEVSIWSSLASWWWGCSVQGSAEGPEFSWDLVSLPGGC